MKQNIAETYRVEGLTKVDIDIIHADAERILSKAAFKETDFIDPKGPYSREAVETDLAEVRRVEEESRQRDHKHPERIHNKKIATIFETIIFQHAELSEWLGGQASTLKTSRFDDIKGVDTVVEFRNPDSSAYLGLAMDVTFSADPDSSEGMTKKFDKIFERLEKGTLNKIKYFHAKNKNINIHGQLNDVPEVVIGADRSTVLELAELWKAKKNNMLAEHRIQIMMLLQIEAQLRVFIAYALQTGKKYIARIFQDRLAIIKKILEQKKDLAARVAPLLGNDKVHYALMDFLKRKEAEITGMKAAA